MNQHSFFNNVSSVLLIKLRAIGDVLLSTPVIENLKRQFPHLQIDFLCEQFAADVVRGNPYLNTILTFKKQSDSGLDLIRKVRSRRYDVIIDLFGNPRTALVTRLSGASHRIGFPFRGRRYAYTHHVNPRGGEVHNVDFNLDVLRKIGIPIVSQQPYFPIDERSEEFARQWISSENLSGRELIGINPSGGWKTKRWPLDSFARLIDEIGRDDHVSVVLFWGPGEFEDMTAIRNTTTVPVHCIPKTSLKEMGALLKHCSYLISNDSGPMHIAASLGIPTLGIYGPTDPTLQGPYGPQNDWVRYETLDCLACNLTRCPIGNVCMKELSVATVYTAFQQLKEKNIIAS
ncbi:MAG: glycosyltransferase family 9 protein [Bacteroidota bacterium]